MAKKNQGDDFSPKDSDGFKWKNPKNTKLKPNDFPPLPPINPKI